MLISFLISTKNTMFKLAGRILDQVDETKGSVKTASNQLAFSDHAIVIEDYEGKIGLRYPINTREEIEDSMDSFEKYASRLMPLHRRTAASFMARACSKYDLPITEKVAMYADDSINERTVSYKKALADYEPSRINKEASNVIQSISNISVTKNLDFGVDENFVKQAAYEMVNILVDTETCETWSPVVKGLQKIAQDDVPVMAENLYDIVEEVCKMASIPVNKTILRDPYNWPKAQLEKEASEDTLDEFILENISKLKGHFNPELLEKIAAKPTKTLAALPQEISKIVADLLTSHE